MGFFQRPELLAQVGCPESNFCSALEIRASAAPGRTHGGIKYWSELSAAWSRVVEVGCGKAGLRRLLHTAGRGFTEEEAGFRRDILGTFAPAEVSTVQVPLKGARDKLMFSTRKLEIFSGYLGGDMNVDNLEFSNSKCLYEALGYFNMHGPRRVSPAEAKKREKFHSGHVWEAIRFSIKKRRELLELRELSYIRYKAKVEQSRNSLFVHLYKSISVLISMMQEESITNQSLELFK